MARIRTIKPEFFTHEDLFDLEQQTNLPIRLAFAGLWTCCDRKGRFKWRPRQLKVSILPYDDCDFSRVLDALATRGFVVKYASGTEIYGYVPSWDEHQFINNKEPESTIPEPTENQILDACLTRESREDDALSTRGVKEGKGKEGKEGNNASESREVEEFLATWNENRGELPEAQKLTATRKKKLSLRIREGLTRETFAQAVKLAAITPFCTGKNDRGWRLDFDFLIENDTNLTKVLEGKYGPPKPRIVYREMTEEEAAAAWNRDFGVM